MPKVSIIIPSYNQGYWLRDAVDSALAQDFEDFEVIIVNDGSTDPVSNRVFDEIDHPKVRKLLTENQGLAAARNTCIEASNAEFILPLDADDRLDPNFLSKTVPLIESNFNVGIVYTNVAFFGEKQGVWKLESYSFPEILISPQIIATALYRREDWKQIGGYSTDMIYGWEDYDFWLSIIESGKTVKHVPEVLFHYRQTDGSMKGLDRNKMLYSFQKLFEHHQELYSKNIKVLFDAVIETKPFRERKSEQQTFEIYIPNEGGYVSTNIREQHYPTGLWSRIEFQVNECLLQNLQRIRLDPGDAIGLFDIASIHITNAIDKTSIWKATEPTEFEKIALAGSAQRLKHDRFLRILNTQNDPYFYLPEFTNPKESDVPLSIEIWICHRKDLSELKGDSSKLTLPDNHEQLVRIRDLEENLQFQKEQETLLKYQEIGLREEAQNLRNERAVLQSEVNVQHATAKSLQAELIALQTEHKSLITQYEELTSQNQTLQNTNQQLEEELKSKSVTIESSKPKRKWF